MPGPRLKTGKRALTLLDVPALAEAHAEKVRAIEADLGTELSTLQQAAVREAARLALIVDSLGDDLLRNGVLTAKGKNRAALSAYVIALDRFHKLMSTVGIEQIRSLGLEPAKLAVVQITNSAEMRALLGPVDHEKTNPGANRTGRPNTNHFAPHLHL